LPEDNQQHGIVPIYSLSPCARLLVPLASDHSLLVTPYRFRYIVICKEELLGFHRWNLLRGRSEGVLPRIPDHNNIKPVALFWIDLDTVRYPKWYGLDDVPFTFLCVHCI